MTNRITIIGRRWFDKKYGNTYFSSRIYVDGGLVKTIPMSYGYGDQYEQVSLDWLKTNGYLEFGLMRFEIREKYNLISSVSDGLKRDLDKEVSHA